MTTLLVLARTLHIGSALLIAGLLFFRLIILSDWEESPAQEVKRRLQRWVIGTFVIHLISGALWFWIVTATMNDCSLVDAWDGNLFQTILEQMQFGRLWILRGSFALAFALSLFLMRKNKINPGWLTFALAILLLASLAWAGHAAAGTSYRMMHLVFDIGHLAVAAIWPVGLVPLALFFHASPRINDPPAISILHRFSNVSLVCVILLSITGLANALFLIPTFMALFTSPYGQLLVAKIILFFIMAGIGATNRFSFLPALANDPSAVTRLRHAVLIENALSLAVLLIVGTMGATSPPQ